MPVFKAWRIQALKQINNFLSINTQWKSKSKLGSEPQVAQNTVLRLWIELTKAAQNTILRLQMEADVVWILFSKSINKSIPQSFDTGGFLISYFIVH